MSGPMRVLSVRQPWAWAIISGGKAVENRSRSLGPYRGPVAIHASLTYDFDAVIMPPPLYSPIPVDETGEHLRPVGAIIGVVDLVDVHDPTDRPFEPWSDGSLCSPWAEDGAFHLVLENPRPLSEPIPFRGGLGLRTLPAGVETEVLRRLA